MTSNQIQKTVKELAKKKALDTKKTEQKVKDKVKHDFEKKIAMV